MNSSTSVSDCRRLLICLILPILTATAVVIALNIALRAAGLQPRLNNWGKSYDDWNVVYTRAVEAKEAGKRVVAFIGDSRIEWGIDPEAIQAFLVQKGFKDVEVFNLALPGRNVRSLLGRLNEAGFHPHVLVVGYSHLSFYWSKNLVEVPLRRLSWWESDQNRLQSFRRRKILMAPYAPLTVRRVLFEGVVPPAQGSWLNRIDVSPRGQARVNYRIPEEEAIAFQKKFYEAMYKVVMTDEMIKATNYAFRKDISQQGAYGTRLLLLKMPLSEWAFRLEAENERATLAELSDYLGARFLDGNVVPGARQLDNFDGLHLMPSASTEFSRWIAEHFIAPNLP